MEATGRSLLTTSILVIVEFYLYIRLSFALRVMSIETTKPVGPELLTIRMSKPFTAKPASNWVMKEVFSSGAN